MAVEVDTGLALALLAFSAPITAAVIKFVRPPSSNGAGVKEYVLKEVCVAYHTNLEKWIKSIALLQENTAKAVNRMGTEVAELRTMIKNGFGHAHDDQEDD